MLHAIFVGIHPFIDGNGRTSRLLLNLELMKEGFPVVVFKVENCLPYYNALDKAHTSVVLLQPATKIVRIINNPTIEVINLDCLKTYILTFNIKF